MMVVGRRTKSGRCKKVERKADLKEIRDASLIVLTEREPCTKNETFGSFEVSQENVCALEQKVLTTLTNHTTPTKGVSPTHLCGSSKLASLQSISINIVFADL